MEKKKFKIAGCADLCDEHTIDVNGEELTVRTHIPLEKKLAMAQELVTFISLIDDENEIMSESHLYQVGLVYLTVLYYTNADLDDVNATDVFDWMINTGVYDQTLENLVYEDRYYVVEMAQAIYKNISNAYAVEHGLAHAVKKTFGFMFNGEDITETLAKSQAISDKMIDVVGKLNAAEQPKSKDGGVKVGGNVIRIAKK